MIEDLLPPEVVAVAVSGDDSSAFLLPEERAQFGWAVESRMQEFTIARSCARRAMRKLGLPATPVLRGFMHEPLWPPGVVGSITHSSGYHAAALARQSDVAAVGIDAEVDDELPFGVLERVVVDEERAWLAEAPSGIHWDRLLFSAKESVYKAWFPITGKWLGFEEVALTFDAGARTFNARLLKPLSMAVGWPRKDVTGRFEVKNGFILTAIAIPAGMLR
jgi:4'-phosphopantetheinyl transferase EntD